MEETIHNPTIEELVRVKQEEIELHENILKEIDNRLVKIYNEKMSQEHHLKEAQKELKKFLKK